MFENPYPGYRHLREHDPVHYEASAGMWFLTRYEDCSAVLRSDRYSAQQGQAQRRRGKALPVSMLNSDPPEHTRLREPAQRLFAAKEVERRSGALRRLVGEYVARVRAGREVDLLGTFAAPLATRILAETVGVPRRDLEWFGAHVVEASANLDPLASSSELVRAEAAAETLREYYAGLTKGNGEWTELSVLPGLERECAARGVTEAEYLDTVNLIVIGGYEPLANLIANGLHALLRFPEQIALLRATPRLAGAAVEEMLRYEPPVPVAARVPREPLAIGDVAVAAECPVVAFLGAANRDPDVFDDPETFAVTRKHNPHLAFGAGVHFCLGAALARMTAQLSLEAILDRFRTIAPAGSVTWRRQLVPRGLVSLPLRVDSA